jgi:integrase/recombinase XerD
MQKAPKGCFWRSGVLWGRTQVAGRDHKQSLHTDDTKIAKQRRKQWADKLVSHVRFGDARFTFDEILAQWATWILKQVGPATAKRYAVSLGQLEAWLSGKYLDEIDGRLVARIIRERDATNATIKRDLVALSSVMNFCIGQGWIESNPVLPRMRLVKERRDPIVLPLPHDVDKVIARAPGLFSRMVAAARLTGARQEELAGARSNQLNLTTRRLEIIGKGNKRRVIDLNPFDAWKLFEGLPEGEYLFSHDDCRYKNVSSRFAVFTKELDLERRFKFHHLRHLFAVEWLRSGRSIYDLQQRLGHSSIKTTEVYLAFLTPEEKRNVMGLTVPANVPVEPVKERNELSLFSSTDNAKGA